MIETTLVTCPYCGEQFETGVDCSAGDQSYIEDCHVCCQPIEFNLHTNDEGEFVNIEARRGDE